jgi:hypothetical protein
MGGSCELKPASQSRQEQQKLVAVASPLVIPLAQKPRAFSQQHQS